MFLATVNKTQRLLSLAYIGRVRAEELRQALVESGALLDELPRGFRVLADLDRLESMEPACAAELGKMMELCDARGVGMVVRVISNPQKDIGLNILAFFHYRNQLSVVTCESMEEAAKALGI
jgi:hypothetical protein